MQIDYAFIRDHLTLSGKSKEELTRQLWEMSNVALGRCVLLHLTGKEGEALPAEQEQQVWAAWGRAYRFEAAHRIAGAWLEDTPDEELDGLYPLDALEDGASHFELRFLSRGWWAARYSAPFGGQDGNWALYRDREEVQDAYAEMLEERSEQS